MICEDTTKLLIRAAALEGDAAITAWELATRELPAKVLAEHHLAPSIYHNLVGIGLLHHQLPELSEVYTRTWALNQRMTKQAKETLQILTEGGFECILLKGAALGISVYGDIGARKLSDIDLLIRHRHRARVIQTLTLNRYQCVYSERKLKAVLKHLHSAAFKNPGGGEIDVHWNLLRTSCWPDCDDVSWARAVEMDWQGSAALTLCDTDHLFHVIGHAYATEIYGQTASLIWIVDAALLIKRRKINWQQFEQLCMEHCLASSMAIQLVRVNQTLGYSAIPHPTIGFLESQRVHVCEHLEWLSKKSVALRFRRQLNAFSQYLRLRRKNDVPSFLHFMKIDWETSSWPEFVVAILKRIAELIKLKN